MYLYGWSEFMLNATNITETVSSQLCRAEIYEGFMILHTPTPWIHIISTCFDNVWRDSITPSAFAKIFI